MKMLEGGELGSTLKFTGFTTQSLWKLKFIYNLTHFCKIYMQLNTHYFPYQADLMTNIHQFWSLLIQTHWSAEKHLKSSAVSSKEHIHYPNSSPRKSILHLLNFSKLIFLFCHLDYWKKKKKPQTINSALVWSIPSIAWYLPAAMDLHHCYSP